MFTDMKEALELTPIGSGQSAAASVVVAHHARDKDDLTRLLPHLPTPDTPTTGVPMPVNAYTTTVSMLNNGDSPEHVRKTFGLSEDELAEAVQNAGLPASDADTEDSTGTPETAAPGPNGKRSKEQLAAIRTWARANGHQVADAGVIRRSVVDAYDAAHRTSALAEAS